ncbi:MAG: biotin transporter BioY, partial [Oscillospiraceae bacterium]
GLAGLVVCHLFGAMQFSLISGKSFMIALLVVSVPYLLKDILSVVAAFVVSLAVGRAMRKTSLVKA